MTIESATYTSDLNAAYPEATTAVSDGDDHLRLLKTVIKATFPNISGAVTPTHTELNYVDGVTSSIQDQLTALTSIVQLAKDDNYTLVASDANKHIYKSNTSAYAWTIPPNSGVAFPVGTVVTLINGGSAGAITVTRGTGVALLLAGSGTDANRTLAAYGMATILKVATNTWYITGTGLT